MSGFQRDREHFEEQLREAGEHFKEANEELNRRAKRPLLWAVVTGLLLGGIVIVGMFLPPVFAVFCALLVALAAFELATALRDSGRRVPRTPLVVLTLGIVAVAYWLGPWWHWVALLIGCVVLVLWRLAELAVPRWRGTFAVVAADIGAGVFVLGYVAFLASFATLLIAQPDGPAWTLAFLIVVVVVDIAAYAVGVSLGRHPMAPRVSPSKSWEGFGGAAAGALLAGVLVSWLLLGEPWWFGLVFGIVLLATATIGDLAESIVKRDLGVKDMSSWLPGHGGVLDRIDGIIVSAPAAYALYLVMH